MERNDNAEPGGEERADQVSRRGLLTGVLLGTAALVVAGCRMGDDDDDDDDDD